MQVLISNIVTMSVPDGSADLKNLLNMSVPDASFVVEYFDHDRT